MSRIIIVSKAKRHLENAKTHRKNRRIYRALSESFLRAGNRGASRYFRNQADDSGAMARNELMIAKQNLPAIYKAKKKLAWVIRTNTRNFWKKFHQKKWQ